MICFSVFTLGLIGHVLSAASVVPPDGKVFLAAWLDTADQPNQPNSGDRPIKFNSRLGLNMSAFQYAENMPSSVSSQYMSDQLNQLSDNSILYITVYPMNSGDGTAAPLSNGPWPVTDQDISYLAGNCSELNAQGRRVLIRLAPEMNGYWMPFGCSPTKFIPFWIKVYNAIKARAPETDLVWAPNAGNNWPWGRTRADLLPEDFALMDTNRNGILDAGDDPYSPFYPGDEYVDWIGASSYHFGTTPPYYENTVPSPGEFEANLNAAGLYDTYGTAKNKPFLIAETGSAYHPDIPTGANELDIKQLWWRQSITSNAFLDKYPMVKLFCMFEVQKIEGDNRADLRDFRISYKEQILNAFKSDFEAVKNRYELATYIPGKNQNGPGISTVKSLRNGEWNQYASVYLVTGALSLLMMINLY